MKAAKNRPIFEPKWGLSADCIRAAKDLKIQNLSNLSAAIGANNSLANQVRIVRNFFAHRGCDTAKKAKQALNLKPNSSFNAFVLDRYLLPGGVPVFEQWINNLLGIARAAIQ